LKTVFLNVCVLLAASLIFAQDEPDKPAGATQGTNEVSLASGGPCTDEFFPPRLCATEAASDFGMVATGSPEATHAAVDILERGGNAIDAAVTAAFMMGVVDSDSSGIGGMTHIVIHLANGRTIAIDGTSNAPLVLDYENFRRLKESGRTYGYET